MQSAGHRQTANPLWLHPLNYRLSRMQGQRDYNHCYVHTGQRAGE